MSNQIKAWELYCKGNELFEQGNIEEAIKAYKSSINLYPKHEEPYNNLGVLLHDLGKYEEASSYFEQGITIALQNSSPFFNKKELATVLAALRLFQEYEAVPDNQMDHFKEVDPLSDSEIDELCERLNCTK